MCAHLWQRNTERRKLRGRAEWANDLDHTQRASWAGTRQLWPAALGGAATPAGKDRRYAPRVAARQSINLQPTIAERTRQRAPAWRTSYSVPQSARRGGVYHVPRLWACDRVQIGRAHV